MKEIGRIYVINSMKIYGKDFFKKVERALEGGAEIFQLRLKGVLEDEFIRVAEKIRGLTVKYGVIFIVNDNPIVAKKVGADGVHVGKGDFKVREAREILGSEKIVGASSYDNIELGKQLEQEGANYLGFSSPFESKTKPGKPLTPIEVLRDAVNIINIPIFAIGGINDDNVEDVLKLGVHGVAVISYIFDEGDPYENVKRLREKVYRYFKKYS